MLKSTQEIKGKCRFMAEVDSIYWHLLKFRNPLYQTRCDMSFFGHTSLCGVGWFWPFLTSTSVCFPVFHGPPLAVTACVSPSPCLYSVIWLILYGQLDVSLGFLRSDWRVIFTSSTGEVHLFYLPYLTAYL